MTTYSGTFIIETPPAYPLSDTIGGTDFHSPNANMIYVLQRAGIAGEGFTSVTVNVLDLSTKYFNKVNFTFVDNGTTTDGFKLILPTTSNLWNVVSLFSDGSNGVPLSRSGSQFLNYPNVDIGSSDPTILSNTSFANIFKNSSKNDSDISDWNISNVTDMTSAFEGNTAFNRDISSWDVVNVVNMTSMFEGATVFNQSLNSWNVGNVTDMSSMFSGDLAFNQPLNNWNVSSVKSMNQMFFENEEFNQPLTNWNVSSVTDMSGMFQGTTSFNKSILLWNVGSVTDMSSMFQGASSFNQNCHWWDTSSVANMSSMFQGATAFNGANVYWDTSSVTDFSNMFNGATVFDQPIELWTVTGSPTLTTMFSSATAMKANTRYDGLPDGVLGPDNNTPNVAFFNQSTRWCLVAGTMITTDQGEIKIEELTKTNTINGLKVLGLSKNHVNSGEDMVLIEKDAIDENVPVKDVCMSTGHRVQYKGQLVKCSDLVGENEKIKMTKLEENQIIYNVLLEKYTTMKANNMDVETLEMHLKYQPGLVKLF